jgi:hypothetical protein
MPPEMQHFTIVYAAYPTHDSSNSFLIKMTIYIQSKRSSSIASWKSWISSWNMPLRSVHGEVMNGGFASNTEYLADMEHVTGTSIDFSRRKILLTHGPMPTRRGRWWRFSGVINIPTDRIQRTGEELIFGENELRVCEEAFSLSYLQAGSLPRGVHYLSVVCDMQTVLQLADGTSTSPVSVRLKGFVQTQRMDIRTCQQWLSPPHFAWHLLHVGSGGNEKDSTDYETAMLQSSGTSWHQLLRCGARVSNNPRRMAAGDVRKAHQEVRNLKICFHIAAIFAQPEIC